MPKIQVTLNEETMKALKETARQERRAIATIIREGIEMRLKQAGVSVDTYLAQGNEGRTDSALRKKGKRTVANG